MDSNIGYKGEITITTFKDGNIIKSTKHNSGKLLLFKGIANYIAGNNINITPRAIMVQKNSANILTSPTPVSGLTVSVSNDSNSATVICSASIKYSQITSGAEYSGDLTFLLLTSTGAASENNILAEATINVADVLSARQTALIEWNMTISNPA